MKTIHSRTLSLLGLALAALPAHAQYGFGSVADTTTLPASAFASADRAYINNNGDVVFTATVSGNRTLIKNIGGVNNIVAAQGSSTVYGSSYDGVGDGVNVVLNDAGQVTFRGNATVGTDGIVAGNNTAIVRDTTIVSREGTTPIGTTTANAINNYSANNANTTVYAGSQTVGGNGLFSVSAGGTATRLIAGGTATPGITGGTFNAFLFPSLDNAGNASFQSTISGVSGVTAGLFNITAGGTVSKIAAVADTDVSGNAYSAFAGIVRGDSGVIAANAVANGNRGIYLGSGDALSSLIARQGLSILGATYGNAFALGNINASGVGVFRATNMTGAFTSAIFTFTSTGQVSKVLSDVDTVFGSTVSSFGVPTINNAGQIAFNYTFSGTGGTQGVFVGTVTVPEAGTSLLLLAGAATLGAVIVRRRK
ncbi:MAG: hypothetical protein H7Y38_02100 [Armatimonadetes bacterium]|nr:hypothetical protein [Armatimonadota bacterium]